ncbi:hypothetical protein [Niallia sp. Krafla_26]|uniref:hypothetical protein n=1 Tax=Niallia sp. Krafla_26 TaxID=3064703 RepID=UPI003D18737E
MIYTVLVITSFFIWAFSVQEPDGTLDVFTYKEIVISYILLIFIAVIVVMISFSASKEESSKISKKAILSGLAVAFAFLILRVLMSIYGSFS